LRIGIVSLNDEIQKLILRFSKAMQLETM